MTKTEIRNALCKGGKLEDILDFSDGQDCQIYKDRFFRTLPDNVIYIPDITLNEIPIDRPVSREEIEHILGNCYTKQDFLGECDGDTILAYRLFCYIDWQHPSSAYPEVDYEDEEDKRRAAESYDSALKSAYKEVSAA